MKSQESRIVLPSIDFSKVSITSLLAAHCMVLEELQRRGVTRSGNNPMGDYAEWLVASKMELRLADKSAKGFDATDAYGTRYEIKARRITPKNRSTQLSPIRNLAGGHFDYLVGVIFDGTWNVATTAKISREVVSSVASYREHVNGRVMHLRPSVLAVLGVEDVTAVFRI